MTRQHALVATPIARRLAALATVLLIAGCAAHRTAPPAKADAPRFPDPASARPRGGTFVNLENLRQVVPGMSKAQVYPLLGPPQFNEGVFGVRHWNYLFNFRSAGGILTCQYQLTFDDERRVVGAAWQPDACKAVLEPPPVAEPSTAGAALPQQPLRLSADALFGFDQASLTAQGQRSLLGLLQSLRDASAVQDLSITGHTDRLGDASYNRQLSLRRAQAVADFLVAHGVPATVMHVQGRGDEQPVVQCAQRRREALIACLAPNRRVEISGVARSAS